MLKNIHVVIVMSIIVSGISTMAVAGISKTTATSTSLKTELNAPIARKELLMDFNWKFHLGDASDPRKDFGYGTDEIFAKEGVGVGAIRSDFNDSSWESINLPHDWAVYLPFVKTDDYAVMGHGYKPLGKEYPSTSIGWYRKTFEVPESDFGKRITLKFDGVFRDCMVWLNGNYVGRNLSGYSEFFFDVTNFVNYGGKNVLVVRVDATNYEGWFYEGAGIYRHVWLIETPGLHIPIYGTYVRTTSLEGNSAALSLETEISNKDALPKRFILESFIVNEDGTVVTNVSSGEIKLSPYEKRKFIQAIKINSPHLWSPDNPYLYKLVSIVKSSNMVVDRIETNFGIRTLRWDKDEGFFLNGKRVEIKGTCNHQDFAGVGVAVPDDIQYYRVEKLKEMGSNAIRTSHNPPTPALLDACDKLGMLVMDENRLLNSSSEYISQFKRLILRDRNHPSVIIWSIGNEEWGVQDKDIGVRIAKTLIRIQKELDPSRVCTFAANDGPAYDHAVNSVIPVRGFNYWLSAIDRYHSEHPDQPLIGTETASTVSTRGEYSKDTTRGYVSDYDVNAPPWGETAEQWWSFYDARKFLAGGFVWTGFDYRGEPTPYRWPDINSHFGIMDMCGFPKNNFYYYKSWWSDRDVLHIFPHWNWGGKEGQPVSVWCFSNCDSVELFLNGKSLGTRKMEKDSHLEWTVNYEPGKLEAKGWRNGKLLETKVETTGVPTSIKLFPYRNSVKDDGEDAVPIAVSVVDSLGREVPNANNMICFQINGPGKIIGVGNGDPGSHEPDKCPDGLWQRSLFNGKCMVIVQSERGKSGAIELSAMSGNLKKALVRIQSRSTHLTPIVE
ncbi:MAG: beta-galactosidase GalA [Candidatus Kryptoniota bacterium]